MILQEPRFIKEDLQYFDEKNGVWKLKSGSPKWAEDEFREFYAKVNPEVDENGIVKQF